MEQEAAALFLAGEDPLSVCSSHLQAETLEEAVRVCLKCLVRRSSHICTHLLNFLGLFPERGAAKVLKPAEAAAMEQRLSLEILGGFSPPFSN